MCFGSMARPRAPRTNERKRRKKEAKAEKEEKKKKREGGGEISTRAGLTNDASLHMPRLTLQIRVQASWLRIREEEEEEE